MVLGPQTVVDQASENLSNPHRPKLNPMKTNLKLSLKQLLSAGCLSALLALGGSAHAAVVIFSGVDPGANSTDPRPNSIAAAAAFDAAALALGSNNIITFESAPLGAFSSLSVASGVTLTGSDFFGANQTIRNTPFGTPDRQFGYNTTAGGSNFLFLNGGSVTFSFATPIDAFGAYITGNQSPLFGQGTITFNDGSTQTLNLANLGDGGGVEFLGFTDAGRLISSVTITSVRDFIGVDDVRYGSPRVNAAPDGGTSALLLGLGLVGLCAARFGRGRNQQEQA